MYLASTWDANCTCDNGLYYYVSHELSGDGYHYCKPVCGENSYADGTDCACNDYE